MYQKSCRLTIADKCYFGGAPQAVTRNISSEWPQIQQLQTSNMNQYKGFHNINQPGSDPILSGLYGAVTPLLQGAATGQLTDQEKRAIDQQTLQKYAEQGNPYGVQGIVSQFLNRDIYSNMKKAAAIGLGTSVFGAGIQGYKALTDPILSYAQDLFDFNANAQNAANIAASNKSGSTTGSVLSTIGSIAGAAGTAY